MTKGNFSARVLTVESRDDLDLILSSLNRLADTFQMSVETLLNEISTRALVERELREREMVYRRLAEGSQTDATA